MSAALFDVGPHGGQATAILRGAQRRERRIEALRIAEYGAFPRAAHDAAPVRAFTRDLSPSGMRLSVDEPQPAGTLLRVVLRDIDGRASRDVVARVVWSRPVRAVRHRGELRHEMGLEIVADRGACADPTRTLAGCSPRRAILMGPDSGELGS